MSSSSKHSPSPVFAYHLYHWNLNPGQQSPVSSCSLASRPHGCALKTAVHTKSRESFIISQCDLPCIKACSKLFTELVSFMWSLPLSWTSPPATFSLTSKLQPHVLLAAPGTVQHMHSFESLCMGCPFHLEYSVPNIRVTSSQCSDSNTRTISEPSTSS